MLCKKGRLFTYLLLGSFHNPLLYSSSRDQAVYVHSLLLPNAMNASHGLQVGLGIPVRVKETKRRRARDLSEYIIVTRKQRISNLFNTYMHVSAVCRLIPNPPLRVDMRKMKSVLPGALNWLII